MEENKKINQLNGYIKEILSNTFEKVGINLFNDKIKMVLENYKKLLFDYSFKNMEELPEFQEALNIILKIQRFGISGLEEETKFINELFPKMEIAKKIEDNIINKYFKKENLTKEQIQNLDKLLVFYIKNRVYSHRLIKVAIEFIEKNGFEFEKFKFVQEFMDNFTELYASITPTEQSRPYFEIMYKIIDKLTKQPNFDLFNNKMILDLLQIQERLPVQDRENISNIILENLKLHETNPEQTKEEIKKMIEENNQCSIEEKNNLLLRNIQTLKLTSNYIMPQEVINYFLRQALNSEQYIVENKERYQIVFESILQDIAKNDVKECCTLFREDYSQKDLKGSAIQKSYVTILAEESVSSMLESKDISLLEIIYHENTHHRQNLDFKQKEKIEGNPLRKKQFKEEIIRKYNPEYYTANYYMMYNEIEARRNGKVKLLELLNSLNLTDYNNQRQNLQEEIKIEDENYKLAGYKRKSINSDEKINVEKYFNELAQKYPEIQKNYSFLIDRDYSDFSNR